MILAVPMLALATTPAVLTSATEGLLLLHVPPPGAASVVVPPAHMPSVPVMDGAAGLTVTMVLATQPTPTV
jgi:hypothetical protein